MFLKVFPCKAYLHLFKLSVNSFTFIFHYSVCWDYSFKVCFFFIYYRILLLTNIWIMEVYYGIILREWLVFSLFIIAYYYYICVYICIIERRLSSSPTTIPDHQPTRVACLYTIYIINYWWSVNLNVLQGVMMQTIYKNAVKMLVKLPNYLENIFSHFGVH